jgi:glycosyltransferase involved in cell wall biosynthesis
MRVLYVSPASELGGSERSLLDLAVALRETAPEVAQSLLLFADGELGRRARALGMQVEVLPLPAALGQLGESSNETAGLAYAMSLARAGLSVPPFLAALRGTVRRTAPDVVHTNGMKAHALALAAVPDLPRVVHLRDFASERPLSKRLLPLFGWRALLVANSQAVADDALSVAPALRTRVVYNGIDLEEFRPGARDPARLSTLAGLGPPPSDVVNVGLVATYAWWKGHRRFIEAARAVVAAEPALPVRFYIIGGPIYRTTGSQLSEQDLRSAIHDHGLDSRMGLVPFQTDAAAAYRDLDVVVHASERPEPFGRTIVEAMATARAVVVARAGGARELFVEGETALGFEPGNTPALAAAISKLVRDPSLRERLGAAARSAAEVRFDRRRLGPELVAVYRELLATVAP